jgi:hypothetical protein
LMTAVIGRSCPAILTWNRFVLWPLWPVFDAIRQTSILSFFSMSATAG